MYVGLLNRKSVPVVISLRIIQKSCSIDRTKCVTVCCMNLCDNGTKYVKFWLIAFIRFSISSFFFATTYNLLLSYWRLWYPDVLPGKLWLSVAAKSCKMIFHGVAVWNLRRNNISWLYSVNKMGVSKCDVYDEDATIYNNSPRSLCNVPDFCHKKRITSACNSTKIIPLRVVNETLKNFLPPPFSYKSRDGQWEI